MSDDHPVIVTAGDAPMDLPSTPRASVEIIACGDCAALERIDPLTLLASATQPCTCACGQDELVCQVCGKPVGVRVMRGELDLGDLGDLADPLGPVAGDLFREDIYDEQTP